MVVVLVVWLSGTGVVAGVRHYGLHTAESSPAAWLLPDPNCIAPCWHGIRTAVTSLDDLIALIQQDPTLTPDSYENMWIYHSPDGREGFVWHSPLQYISVYMEATRLGDWLAVLGPPTYQSLTPAINPNTGRREYLVRLYYEQQQAMVLVRLSHEERLSAWTQIQAVEYPRDYFARPFYSFDWLGLIRLESYPLLDE